MMVDTPPLPTRPDKDLAAQVSLSRDQGQATDGRRKRPRATTTEDEKEENDVQQTTDHARRRRRKLSCETCQKRKSRCDYDPISRICHRCRTLRIPCSLADESNITNIPDGTFQEGHVSLEERPFSLESLRRNEASIRDILSLLRDHRASVHPVQTATNGYLSSKANTRGQRSTPLQDDVELDSMAGPADEGINSAPAAVIREVTQQISGISRKLQHVSPDLVKLGILDEATADNLIRLFYRHRGQALLVCEGKKPLSSKELRKKSPFLHSVCCVQGSFYSDNDFFEQTACRQAYEKVRSTLGQALLASPLPLEDINAILLMSVYSNHYPTVGGQVDYIDSWLLTGYCAQQAMLSISFSDIVQNARRGKSTESEKTAIRLWANICLHHLHWAATTGRPSTLSSVYLNQCSLLTDIFQNSAQECIMLADILLYATLNRKLARHSHLGPDGECEEFVTWKQKWAHLFASPKSFVFKLSYHAVYLILSVRSLEDFDQGRQLENLLSPDTPSDVSHKQHKRNEMSHVKEGHALRFAIEILETFFEMSVSARNDIPIYLTMCVSYSALVIAQYWREDLSETSGDTVLSLISALDEWSATGPNLSLAAPYAAGLARRRVQACMQVPDAQLGSHPPGTEDLASSMPVYNAAEGLLGLGNPLNTQNNQPMHGGMELGPDVSGLDLTPEFPSMEDFFGGGFLDFIK